MVKELDLNKDYSAKTAFYKRPVIYFQNSPIDIELTSGNLDTISQGTEFELDLKDHGKKFHLRVLSKLCLTTIFPVCLTP